jgi:hypothetical protein
MNDMTNQAVAWMKYQKALTLSQPLGKRWLVDDYAGLWLFTKNDSYYPGSAVRTQNPPMKVIDK